MLRSQQRRLQEYLAEREHNEKNAAHVSDKKRLKYALDESKPIPADLRANITMREKLNFESTETLTVKRDDEYRVAGSYEPKLLLTTSGHPSQPTIIFAKELKLLFPNCIRINRGQTNATGLAELCRREEVTDLIEVSGSDKQGRPTMLQISHFPFGPTIRFTLSDIVMRADLPGKPAHMSEAYPNLIFDKFDSPLGLRIKSILKYLFPVTPTTSKSNRVLTFANLGDKIYFRHNTWESTSTLRKFHQNDPAIASMTQGEKEKLMNKIEINEIGPRFTLTPYSIKRGTFEVKDADDEWVRSSFIRKPKAILA